MEVKTESWKILKVKDKTLFGLQCFNYLNIFSYLDSWSDAVIVRPLIKNAPFQILTGVLTEFPEARRHVEG
jgi:hypothetical protein